MLSESTRKVYPTQVSDLLDRWRQLREQGQTITPDELCQDCPELLPSVRELLDDLPPLPPPTPRQSAGLPQVPGYEILSELGRGGMGVVYQARHLRLNRIVALKMVLSAHAGPEELVRFRTEAEAVARLQHPNIVQIHEIGEQHGQPYFSLEFCGGGSLAEHIRGTALPPFEAARLVETLASAMHVAHQQNIVHRDLKPANVLVAGGPWQATGEGNVNEAPTIRLPPGGTTSCTSRHAAGAILKITDFGLAKKLDADVGQTQTGTILGTPSYMGPEQARGALKEVGPHTDIYALGAILYELLTTRPPFLAPTIVDTLMLVVNQEPVPPSQLQPNVPRDLETICLKCLHKDPARRYASAEALAQDLWRFQNGEPIVARPVGRLERSWKWTKRRPAVAALSAALVLAMMVGFGMVTWKWQEAEDRRQEAERAREDEKSAHTDAEKRRQEAERAREDEKSARTDAEKRRQEAVAQSELTKNYFGRLQGAVKELLSEVSNDTLKNEPRFELVRKKLLDKALAYYQRFLEDKTDDPTVRLTTAVAYRDVGEIQQQLSCKEEAEKAYRTSVHMLQALTEELPEPKEYRKDLAASCNKLANLLLHTNQFQEAETVHLQAYQLRKKLVKDFGRRGIGLPLTAAYRQDLAMSCNNLAALLAMTRRPLEAEKLHLEGYELRQQLVKDFPTVAAYRQDLAMSCNNLGIRCAKKDQLEEAEKLFRQAYELRQKLVEDFPTEAIYRQDFANSCGSLGVLLRDTKQVEEAEKLFRQAFWSYQQLAEQFPNVAEYRFDAARSLDLLADLHRKQKHWHKARAAYEHDAKSFALVAKQDPSNSLAVEKTLLATQRLAEACVELGQYADAALTLEALVKLSDKDADMLHIAAVLYARCIPLAAKDAELSDAQRQQLTKSYADQAMAVLKRAVVHGDRDLDDLQTNAVFVPLRPREDFQALIRQIRQLEDGK